MSDTTKIVDDTTRGPAPRRRSTKAVLARRLVCCLALLTLAGCASEPQLRGGGPLQRSDKDLSDLLSAYKARMAALDKQQKSHDEAAIQQLVVEADSKTGRPVVSAKLVDAPASAVVARILKAADQPYNFSGVQISGRTSAQFNRLPLVDALNQVVATNGVFVADQKGVLVFQNGPAPAPQSSTAAASAAATATTTATTGSSYAEYTLKHVSMTNALTMLKGLYWGGNDTAPGSLMFGSLPELNRIYVSGPKNEVKNVVAVLEQADKQVPQVLIEVLVVNFDVTAASQLGTNITNGAKGNFSDISLIPGATSGNINLSFLQGATNAAQLTAAIDLLISRNDAKVLARPYIVARSDSTAKVGIVNDAYVTVEKTSTGVSVASTQAVNAGIQLTVTPKVEENNMINLDLQVEDSRFVATVSDALIEKESNTASTSVNVKSGQTVIVGGLKVRKHSTSNAGLPWLRNIPLLNLLTANRGSTDDHRELVVYLTPRIWTPGLSTPLEMRDTFLSDHKPGQPNH